jgi:hypothetical protein
MRSEKRGIIVKAVEVAQSGDKFPEVRDDLAIDVLVNALVDLLLIGIMDNQLPSAKIKLALVSSFVQSDDPTHCTRGRIVGPNCFFNVPISFKSRSLTWLKKPRVMTA